MTLKAVAGAAVTILTLVGMLFAAYNHLDSRYVSHDELQSFRFVLDLASAEEAIGDAQDALSYYTTMIDNEEPLTATQMMRYQEKREELARAEAAKVKLVMDFTRRTAGGVGSEVP